MGDNLKSWHILAFEPKYLKIFLHFKKWSKRRQRKGSLRRARWRHSGWKNLHLRIFTHVVKGLLKYQWKRPRILLQFPRSSKPSDCHQNLQNHHQRNSSLKNTVFAQSRSRRFVSGSYLVNFGDLVFEQHYRTSILRDLRPGRKIQWRVWSKSWLHLVYWMEVGLRGGMEAWHKKIQSCQNWRWQKCLRCCRLEILTVLVPFDDGSVLPGKIGMSWVWTRGNKSHFLTHCQSSFRTIFPFCEVAAHLQWATSFLNLKAGML